MNAKSFLPISCLLLAFTCGRDYTGPDIDFGSGEGITYRDEQGRPNGPLDASDWTSDTTWNEQELSYFTFPTFSINGPQQVSAVQSILAYPNPAPAGQVVWRLKLAPTAPCPCQVYFSLVSKRYTNIDGYQAELAAGDSVQLALKAYNPGQLYRTYYIVYNANGLLYKGHGDVRFTP